MKLVMGLLGCMMLLCISTVSHGSDGATTAKSEMLEKMVSPIDFQMEADVIVTKSTVTALHAEVVEYCNIGEAITINNVESVNPAKTAVQVTPCTFIVILEYLPKCSLQSSVVCLQIFGGTDNVI